jgi:group II intron reverse transcriptase/maturase
LDRVRQAAKDKERKNERFHALLHHVDPDLLTEAFSELKEEAAPGADGRTWKDYDKDLGRNIEDLHSRVHRGAYRALPSRRQYIPKADGRQRPIAICALEDKIIQRAVVKVLNEIYEAEFIGFSYGFRPGGSQHKALDAVIHGINTQKVNWILEVDIQSFFDEVDRERLIELYQQRIGDPRILDLFQKWLKAGVLEDGVVHDSGRGTGQGTVISPLHANVYLHYVFDVWAKQWRDRMAPGEMIIVRYADDIVVGFKHEYLARRFLKELRERLQEFSLTLHPVKTKLLEFGRFAAENRKRRGQDKPETFEFLGFTLICSKDRKGAFLVKRRSRRDRMKAKLKDISDQLRRRMHWPIPEQGVWLGRVVKGYFQYHAVPTNIASLETFRLEVVARWRKVLLRRSQKKKSNKKKGAITFERMAQWADYWLPKAKILHPWPSERFAVKHSK